RRLPGRAPGRDERLQGAAAPLGPWLDPGRAQAPSANLEERRAARREARGHVPPHVQRALRAAPPALAHRLPGRTRALLEPERLLPRRGHGTPPRRDRPGARVLRAGGARLRALAAPVGSARDDPGDRTRGQQHARGPRGTLLPRGGLPPDAKVPARGAAGPVARQALSIAGTRPRAPRARARRLLRVGHAGARARRPLGAAAVLPSLPLRIPLRGRALGGPRLAPLLRRRRTRGRAGP